ncbi:MAG: hypothetical protein ABSG91_06375 [Syntrophobacteraceae bacterium]
MKRGIQGRPARQYGRKIGANGTLTGIGGDPRTVRTTGSTTFCAGHLMLTGLGLGGGVAIWVLGRPLERIVN